MIVVNGIIMKASSACSYTYDDITTPMGSRLCMRMCVYISVYVKAHIYIYIYTHTYLHIYVYIYIYIYDKYCLE